VQELGPNGWSCSKKSCRAPRRSARLYQATSNIAAAHEVSIKQHDDAARALGVKLEHIAVSDAKTLQQAFAAARNRINGSSSRTDGFLLRNRTYIAELGISIGCRS